MAGIMIEPMAATSAMATPVSPAKSVLATMVTCASPPRMWPTRTFENSTKRVGDARLVHERPGEHEQRHGHDGEAVAPRHHLARQHQQVGRFPEEIDPAHGHDAEHVADRDPQRHQGEKSTNQDGVP